MFLFSSPFYFDYQSAFQEPERRRGSVRYHWIRTRRRRDGIKEGLKRKGKGKSAVKFAAKTSFPENHPLLSKSIPIVSRAFFPLLLSFSPKPVAHLFIPFPRLSSTPSCRDFPKLISGAVSAFGLRYRASPRLPFASSPTDNQVQTEGGGLFIHFVESETLGVGRYMGVELLHDK